MTLPANLAEMINSLLEVFVTILTKLELTDAADTVVRLEEKVAEWLA